MSRVEPRAQRVSGQFANTIVAGQRYRGNALPGDRPPALRGISGGIRSARQAAPGEADRGRGSQAVGGGLPGGADFGPYAVLSRPKPAPNTAVTSTAKLGSSTDVAVVPRGNSPWTR